MSNSKVNINLNLSHKNKDSVISSSQAVKRSADDNESQDTSEPKKKVVIGFNKFTKKDDLLNKKMVSNISIKLGASSIAKPSAIGSGSKALKSKPKVGKAALAFKDDSEESEEEMPPEAKMRMKNIGRETPTSSGPNSFGKSRMGFCDSKKLYERKMKEIQDQLEEADQ